MSKETAYFYVGLGVNVLLGILQLTGITLPMAVAILGYIVGVGLMLLGGISYFRGKKALGDLLLEGEKILEKIDELKADDANALAHDWIDRTHKYLKKRLLEHASIFLSDSGLDKVTYLKIRIKNRLTRLRHIMGIT